MGLARLAVGRARPFYWVNLKVGHVMDNRSFLAAYVVWVLDDKPLISHTN